MKKRIGLFLSLVLSAMFVIGLGLQDDDTDLSWVAGLVGFTSGTQTITDEGTTIVYTIFDGKEAITLLREGLEDRGWRIKKPENVTILTENVGVFVGTLTAYKGDAELKASVQGAGTSQSLVMHLTGGTTPPPATKGRSKSTKVDVATSGQGSTSVNVTTSKSSGRTTGTHTQVETSTVPSEKEIIIKENEVEDTIFCQGEVIKILGNDCNLKLTGHCSALKVLGNDNVVKIEGIIDVIKTNGNRNVVTWQASQKPQPKISNLGSENTLQAEE